MATLNRLLSSLADLLLRESRRSARRPTATTTSNRPTTSSPRHPISTSASVAAPPAYPGDFTGIPELRYDPQDDADADPGEVVWTWVPYEEDHRQGKDRPVLVIGHDGPWLLALPMTSKDHDRDARQEAAAGRFWCDIGSGSWDREGRASEVRVNRILRIDPTGIRRIAARLDHHRFETVAREVLRHSR